MIALVFGSRAYTNRAYLFGVLTAVHAARPLQTVVEGCADGADTLAYRWAQQAGTSPPRVEHEPAPWSHLGKRAGPYRNRAMLRRHEVGLALGFHDDPNVEALEHSGTADMAKAARRIQVPTFILPRDWDDLKEWLK